jgi:hypothetical protein
MGLRRLHSGIGYVAPKAKLEGREVEIFTERDRKLQEARERRAAARSAERAEKLATKLQQQTEVQQTPVPDVTASCEAEGECPGLYFVLPSRCRCTWAVQFLLTQ